MINAALPKGRLTENITLLLAKAGHVFNGFNDNNRKLIFTDNSEKLRAFRVKPFDVPVYVERGVADIGIAGSDILNEIKPDVLQLLDLKIGLCFMAVAAPLGFKDNGLSPLRAATEFPNTAREFFSGKGRDVDIITLRGSLEAAPNLGLADLIVDIVQTGTTLRENGLRITEKIADISAWLIVNKSSYIFKFNEINLLLKELNNLL